MRSKRSKETKGNKREGRHVCVHVLMLLLCLVLCIVDLKRGVCDKK